MSTLIGMKAACFLVLLGVLACDLGSAVMTLLDGRRIVGESPAITEAEVNLGGTTFPLAEVDWFASRETPPAVIMGDLGATLADGSWIPLRSIVGGDDDVITVESPLGTLTLPLGVVIGWGSSAWLDGQVSEGDQVLLKRDRAGAETWRGQVLGVSADALLLQTDLQDEPLNLPLANVMGMRLGLPIEEPKGLYFRTRFDENRPACALAPIWPPALAIDPTITVNPQALPVMRLFGGRRVSLLDIKPTEVIEEGAFGVVWPYSRNANLDGSALYLDGRRVDTGLVLHSRATLSWDLNKGFERFRTTLGISDLVRDVGDCAVTISVDGAPRWQRQSVTGDMDPVSVDIDLKGAESLQILVDFGEKYDIGDHLVLADPFLLRSP